MTTSAYHLALCLGRQAALVAGHCPRQHVTRGASAPALGMLCNAAGMTADVACQCMLVSGAGLAAGMGDVSMMHMQRHEECECLGCSCWEEQVLSKCISTLQVLLEFRTF